MAFNAKYKAALYQYSAEKQQWILIEDDNKYVYKNDLYDDVTSNVVVISKEDITNHKNIDFTIYNKVLDDNGLVWDNDLVVSNASTTIFDLNDPIISNTEPEGAQDGQLWLDTSDSPYTLYIYQNKKWVYFNQQMGKTIHTSKPETYSQGDIWILSEGYEEIIGGTTYYYGEGTMLRATETVVVVGGFSITHWADADSNMSDTITNIKESFSWDDTGINIAKKMKYASGDVISPFYVHIDSERMGFHSVVNKEDIEVVHIGNNSSTIKNATFEGNDGTIFNNNASFYNQVNILNQDSKGKETGFTFQTEADGSFSLILIES